MCHFTTTEAQGDFHLIAFAEEALHGFHLRLIIMIVDGRAHLDLFELDDLLLLACLGGLLLLLVFVLAVVHQLDHGRLGVRRNLDEIVAALFRDGAGFVDTDLSEFFSLVTDQKDGAGMDVFIDAGAIFGSGPLLRGIETSGDYDSLLSKAVRSRFAGHSVEPRETRFDLWRSGLSFVNATGIGCPATVARPRIRGENRVPKPLRKGYSATSLRDSASVLMREMKVSRGIAPRSFPERSRTATLPSAASRSPTTSM